MLRVFVGYDPREAIGFHVCTQSIIETASKPVQIIPLWGKQRDGSNAFTYARFLVPYFCEFKGPAVFIDGSDMLVRKDINILGDYGNDPSKAVHVVHHVYKTTSPRKYIGTAMECDNDDYPRKNWSSVMVFNCMHAKHKRMVPDFVNDAPGSILHRFEWLSNHEIGVLPEKWNVLIGEMGDDKNCNIAHFTLGVPIIPKYKDAPYADEWLATAERMAVSP